MLRSPSATIAKAIVWRLPLVHTTHLDIAQVQRRSPIWQILGASPEGNYTPIQIDWSRPTVVLLGHERHGLSSEDQGVVTATVKIPRVIGADSLNVGMSGTVFAYLGGQVS